MSICRECAHNNRYGWFSYEFEYLFHIQNVEFILQEKSYGYDLRVNGKDFYFNLLRQKRNRAEFARKKQLFEEMAFFNQHNVSDENASSFQHANRYFYQITPEVVSLNSVSSLGGSHWRGLIRKPWLPGTSMKIL